MPFHGEAGGALVSVGMSHHSCSIAEHCWDGCVGKATPRRKTARAVTQHNCREDAGMACCSGCSARFTTNPSTPLAQNPRTNSHRVAGFFLNLLAEASSEVKAHHPGKSDIEVLQLRSASEGFELARSRLSHHFWNGEKFRDSSGLVQISLQIQWLIWQRGGAPREAHF